MFLIPYLILFFGTLFVAKVILRYDNADTLAYVGIIMLVCGSVITVLLLV